MAPTLRKTGLALAVAAQFAGLSRGEFDPNGTSNVFVYFAQASGRNADLDVLCSNRNIDAVILGFIRDFNGTAGYPTVDFGPWACPSRRAANATVAPGLASCPELGRKVQRCQDSGKKVFVSVGGSASNTSFSEDGGGGDAKDAAHQLWGLFGEGSVDADVRPLGTAVVDGFDIDHEVGSPASYDTFAATLRGLMARASKPMWISAAPLCALTSRTIGNRTLGLVDFIFVRFYNAKECSLGTRGFARSLAKWYTAMPRPTEPFPKFYLSALSFENNNSAGGFVPPEDLEHAIAMARDPNLQRFSPQKFGGVTLWDGVRGLATMAGNGDDFIAYTKNVLGNA